jgi:hypothetical protein
VGMGRVASAGRLGGTGWPVPVRLHQEQQRPLASAAQ